MNVERVAFLSSEYPPHTYGGLGTAVEALTRFLAAEGVGVVLLVPDVADYDQPPPGVELLPVPTEGATSDEDYWLTYCESAVDIAHRTDLQVDVVHCHDWMTVLGGLGIGRAIHAPVLLTVHLPQSAPTNLVLENIGIAGCDSVLVNSHDIRAELTARHVDGGGEIVVIPNGVDLTQFSTRGQPPKPQQILFVGRLVPQKGVDVLIRAFGAILRRHPSATLVIAGDGQQRLYLERLARFLGVRQHISFLGWQSRQDLIELYRDSAVTAVPSLYEPFGLVALEAMACGRPVVVSRVGGLTEILDEGVSGFIVEAGDHLDLATRLAALISDLDLARTKGRAARHRAEKFDWTIIATRTAQMYDSLTSRLNTEQTEEESINTINRVLSTAEPDLRARISSLFFLDAVPYQSHLAHKPVTE